jgi:hypothetical protein
MISDAIGANTWLVFVNCDKTSLCTRFKASQIFVREPAIKLCFRVVSPWPRNISLILTEAF